MVVVVGVEMSGSGKNRPNGLAASTNYKILASCTRNGMGGFMEDLEVGSISHTHCVLYKYTFLLHVHV